jgi:uncharacterized protein YdaU (DUF1376 family)
MIMKQNNWMPFHVGDYLRDTGHLTTVEHGAYFLLLCHAWTHDGALPNDEVRLRCIAKMSVREWKRSSATLRAFFYVDGDTLRQRRVDREMAKSKEISEQRKAAGKASAVAREAQRKSNKRSTTVDLPVDVPSQQNARQEQEQEQEKKETSLREAKKATAEPNGSRLPADWSPGPEGFAFASTHGLNPEVTFQEFRDYWQAKPGKDGRKLDWMSTWRNWCRRDRRSATPRLFPPPQTDNWNQF